MKNVYKLALSAMVTLLTVTLVACGKTSRTNPNEAKTQTLNWMQNANLITLDPSKCVDAISSTTLSNADRGLVISPKPNKLKLALADKMNVSPDGKTYTFHLRKAKWSNGDPVTANDFVFGFQHTVDPKTASQDAFLLDHIVNYDAVSKGKLPTSALGVSAPDKYTFVVRLSAPQVYFKDLLIQTAFLPQDKKFADKMGKKYGTNSDAQVYNGPFKVQKWTGINDSWSLVKNNNYWDKKHVKLNRLNMHVVKDQQTGLNEYETGALDELSLSGKQQVGNFRHTKDLHIKSTTYANYIELNEKKDPAFKNLKLRQAISYALNREEYVKDVLGDGSKPIKGFVADGLAKHKGKDFAKVAHVKGTAVYDFNKAKKLWKQGLKEVGKKSLNVSLTYDDTDVAKSTTEYLQTQLQKLPGLKINNVNLPREQRISRLMSENFDMCVTGWDPGYDDPISALSIRTSDSSINFSKWNNPEYNQLIARSNKQDANNPDQRWNDLVNAEKVFEKDVGAVPFYQGSDPVAMKTNIKGAIDNTAGNGWDFSNAYVAK